MPVIETGLVIGSLIVGAVTSIFGAAAKADAAAESQVASNKAAEYNAQLYENNAAIIEAQAEYTEAKGRRDSKLHTLQISKRIGSQRAAYAASGAVVDQGSAYHNLMDTVTWGAFDSMTILNNASMEALGQKAEALDLRDRAKITRDTKQSPDAVRTSSLTGSVISAGGKLANFGLNNADSIFKGK